ncbi:probable transcription factor PosF21 [Rutidosis leptorrhynchoides]|uniref:probable transcription factor PosF21 n=1 Tax=Rutidosis leptorrhynchoides TaxID=125765 RepID=UPI003A99CCD0
MENNQSHNPCGMNTLPPFGSKESMKSDSIMSPEKGFGTATETGQCSHDDISRMPDTPPKYTGHRRAHSEIFTLPDDISFDYESDLGIVGDGPEETEEDLFSMYVDMENLKSSSAKPGPQVEDSSKTSATSLPEHHVKHQHTMSMGENTFKQEDASLTDYKKSLSATKLAELAIVDPKRAKRIWANRQSAARSKERKIRYIAELEKKVHALQTDGTSMSAQLNLLQRQTHGLSAENNELKLRIHGMEQQVNLQDALNDGLKKEIQHLKVVTGQNLTNGGPVMNYPPPFGLNQWFHPNNQAAATQTMLTAQQFQQLQIQSRNQHQHLFQQPQFNQQQQHQRQQFQQQQQQKFG